MEEATRKKICRLVAGLVIADDELDASEDAVIDHMLALFGLKPEEREWLFPIIEPKEAAEELASLPNELQAKCFEMLVHAAAVDKKFVDEERAYLLAVGKVLGLSPEEVEARVAEALAKA